VIKTSATDTPAAAAMDSMKDDLMPLLSALNSEAVVLRVMIAVIRLLYVHRYPASHLQLRMVELPSLEWVCAGHVRSVVVLTQK
jgi:hypothetical protein